LAGQELDVHWLLRHANAIEGHPDNVAAAICGGFVLAYEGRDGVSVVASPVDASVAASIFVADTPVGTRAARGLLPESIPHVDAAANSGRAALLVHALAHDPDRLFDATHDWLHQSYRAKAMPRSYELLTSLRGRGFAAVISGAGPSVAVLGRASELRPLAGMRWPHFALQHLEIGTGVAVLATSANATGDQITRI
jgi:homoserine kinase